MARLLIIDDDPSTLELEKAILMNAGYEVIASDSALAALNMLQLYHVDLIVADIQMPRFSGLQFAQTVKKNPQFRSLPIAFLSASTEKEHVLSAAKLGAYFYISKPIKTKIFLEKIQSIFDKHPPQEHPKLELKSPVSLEIKILQSMQIFAISEIGIEVLVSEAMQIGQVVELPNTFFKDIFTENPRFVVFTVRPQDGLSRVTLVLKDQSLASVRKLQKFVIQRLQIWPAA